MLLYNCLKTKIIFLTIIFCIGTIHISFASKNPRRNSLEILAPLYMTKLSDLEIYNTITQEFDILLKQQIKKQHRSILPGQAEELEQPFSATSKKFNSPIEITVKQKPRLHFSQKKFLENCYNNNKKYTVAPKDDPYFLKDCIKARNINKLLALMPSRPLPSAHFCPADMDSIDPSHEIFTIKPSKSDLVHPGFEKIILPSVTLINYPEPSAHFCSTQMDYMEDGIGTIKRDNSQTENLASALLFSGNLSKITDLTQARFFKTEQEAPTTENRDVSDLRLKIPYSSTREGVKEFIKQFQLSHTCKKPIYYGGYYFLNIAGLFKGVRFGPSSITELTLGKYIENTYSSAYSLEELSEQRKEISGLFKFDITPENFDGFQKVMAILLPAIDKDPEFQELVNCIKVFGTTYFPLTKEKYNQSLEEHGRFYPSIVIAATMGINKAQRLANKLNELLKNTNIKGIDFELPYKMSLSKPGKKRTLLWTYAGNTDEKKGDYLPYFDHEDEDGAFYKSNFIDPENPQYLGLRNPNDPDSDSLPGSISPRLQDSEKGKEKEEIVEHEPEDDLQMIEPLSEGSLWTEKKLQELREFPFGKFFETILRTRNNIDNKAPEEMLGSLNNIALGESTNLNLNDLQQRLIDRAQSIDLSALDEELIVLPKKLETKFKDYAWKRKMVNPSKKENGIITFLLFHGTFVDFTEFGGNPDTQLTKDLMFAAKIIGRENNCAVNVISFNWSGELSAESRAEAASVLKDYFVTDEECMNSTQVVAFSHSFGGDVLLQFAKRLKPYQKKIKWAAMAGTPSGESTGLVTVDKSPRILDNTDSQTDSNIEYTLQAYSKGDMTQAGGSIQMTQGFWNPTGTPERRLPFNGNSVINMHWEHEGRLCSHIDIKWHLAKNLPFILPMIFSLYPHVKDLSIASFDNALPLIAHRNFIVSPGYLSTQDRSFDAHFLANKKFKELYGRDIGTSNTWLILKAYQEFRHAGLDQKNQGHAKKE